jgi:hypothetical protein
MTDDQVPDEIPFPAYERALIRDMPWPAGTVLYSEWGTVHTVADRDGRAFLACCTAHETAGVSRGWYLTRHPNGRIRLRGLTVATRDQAAWPCLHDPANPFGVVASVDDDD